MNESFNDRKKIVVIGNQIQKFLKAKNVMLCDF